MIVNLKVVRLVNQYDTALDTKEKIACEPISFFFSYCSLIYVLPSFVFIKLNIVVALF